MINFLFILNNDSKYYVQQQQLQLPPHAAELRAESIDLYANSPTNEVTHTTPLNTAVNSNVNNLSSSSNISNSIRNSNNYQVSYSSSSMPSPTVSPFSTLFASSESRTNEQGDNLLAPSSSSSNVKTLSSSSTTSTTTISATNGGNNLFNVNPSDTASAMNNVNGQVDSVRSLSWSSAGGVGGGDAVIAATLPPPGVAYNLLETSAAGGNIAVQSSSSSSSSQEQVSSSSPSQEQMVSPATGSAASHQRTPVVAGTPIQKVPVARKITFSHEDLEETKRLAINKVNFCDEDNGATNDLLVVVTSSVTHFDARAAIRKTWGKFAVERGSLVLFLLGSPDPSSPDASVLQEKIKEEESVHGDLLQGAFVDNYYNLTLKTLSMLRWVNQTCDRVKYILKIDDDMFVNMQMVVDFAETRTFNKAIIGKLARRWKPHREKYSKWYVPTSAFNGSVYPNFATGPAYMITGDAVKPLLDSALSGTPIYLEDVYVTGIAAERAGVRRLNHALMKNVKLKVDACSFRRFITSHMHSPDDIVRLWDVVYDPYELKKCTAAIASAAAKAAAERKNAPVKPLVSSTTRQFATKV